MFCFFLTNFANHGKSGLIDPVTRNAERVCLIESVINHLNGLTDSANAMQSTTLTP